MTCQECQPLAIDLARGLPPFDVGGAVQRSDVLSHIARCKRCAEWLKEQEALSEALRAAAEADASLSAPPGVEANVMAAWRARQAQRQSLAHQASLAHPKPLAHPAPVAHPELFADTSPESPVRAWRPVRPLWRPSVFAAAATIVLLALTLTSLRWLNAPPAARVVTNNAGASNAAGAPTPSPMSARPGEAASESGRARVTGHSEGTNAAVVEVLPDKRTKGRPPTPPVTVRQAAATRRVNPARGVSATRGVSEFSERAFVLLPYVEPLRPTEMRHIMRVRMPRTQFEAGETQASGVDGATVLADVLVGEDGTARAVRIVQ
jgi:hypothetical protein